MTAHLRGPAGQRPEKTKAPFGTRQPLRRSNNRRVEREGYSQEKFLAACIRKHGGDDWLAEVSGLASSGQLDAHHIVEKDDIEKAHSWARYRGTDQFQGKTLGEVLMDTDNGVVVSRVLHGLWHNNRFEIERRDLPMHVERFAEKYALTHILDRDYGERG